MRCREALWGAAVTIMLAAHSHASVLAGYSRVVLDDNPVGYWRLNEAPGATQAADSSGLGHHLDLTGFDAGQFGSLGATGDGDAALYFRDAKGGSTREDTAESPNTTDFSFASGQSFTIEYWVKVAPGHASSSDPGILTNGYDSTSQSLPWYLSRLTGSGDTRSVDFFLRDSSSASKQALGTTNLVDDAWHHVVGVYDAGAAEVRLYVDSALEATATGVPADAYGTNARSFILGNHYNRTLDARLDEVAMYASALDANQIVSHFQAAQNKLMVDFGNSLGSGGGPGGRQDGFFDIESAEGSGNPAVTRTLDSGLGADGTVDVTIAGYTHFRDYASLTGGPLIDQNKLLSDIVLRNSDGIMTLTLEGLTDGAYQITTYHHNTTQTAAGTILQTLLTDGVVTDLVVSTDFLETIGRAPTSVATQTFGFNVVNGSPVLIEFSGGEASRHIQLNGFELRKIPEPSSLTLALVAALGCAILPLGRRRRHAPVGKA